jgi:hypothetical protein
VTLCVLAVLMVASVASAQGMNDKDLPPPPPDSDPRLPSEVGELPKGGPPGDPKELLKAGGDLIRLRSPLHHPRPTTADASPCGGSLR